MKIANFDPTYADILAGGMGAVASGTVARSPWKAAARVATTRSGSITADFVAGATVDGVTLALDDRLLVKNQTSGAENGIYIVRAAGSPTRTGDFDAGDEITGAIIPVATGTVNGGHIFVVATPGTITVGTTPIAFADLSVVMPRGSFELPAHPDLPHGLPSGRDGIIDWLVTRVTTAAPSSADYLYLVQIAT